MKKSTLLMLFLSLFMTSAMLTAQNEPPDFPNTGTGPNFNLALGANNYSGTITTPSDGQDRFQITLLAGQAITSITTSITTGGGPSGFFDVNGSSVNFPGGNIPTVPASAGTYQVLIAAGFSVGESWNMTVNVTAVVACTDPTVPTLTASPTSVCPGSAVTLSLSGTLNDATTWQWYSGSCGGTAVGTGTSITVNPTSNTTYFARGIGGCVTPGTCGSVSVTATDSTPPTAFCSTFTAQLNAAGNVSITAADVDGGSSDACGIASLSVSPSSFTCANVGANTVTLTVTDVNGNSSNCTTTVTVEDNVAPTAVCAPFTAQLNASGNVSITAADVDGGSSDNCGIASLSVSPSSFTCANVGANTVTLTVTDVNGNSSNCTATVTVEDNVAPTAVCMPFTAQLDASGNVSITAADVDGGSSDNCGIASLSVSPSSFTCVNVGANTVTLTVTDVNGNSSNCTTTVTVEDNVAPTAVCSPFTAQLDASGNVSITTADVDGGSSDNCGIASLSVSPSSFTCANVGANTVTLTVTDVNGNSSNCTTTVTVEDNVAPTAVCTPFTAQLDASGNVSITAADVDGGSSDACGIASLAVSPSTFTCANVGANTVTLTVTDVNGNSSNCTATVTVEDNVAPTAVCTPFTAELDASGNISITPTDVDGGSSDACGIASLSVSPNTFTCANVGANTVTLTVTDVNGNSSNCTTTVTVEDNIDPVIACPADVTANTELGACNAIVSFVDAIAIDNCGIASVVQTSGLPSGSAFPVGISTIEYTATDVNGNISVCDFTITVTDNEPAMAVCQDITIQLDASGNATIVAADLDGGSTDNCGVDSIAISMDTFDCSHVGTNNVTLEVTDDNGNISSCIAVVTVEDNIAPVITCIGEQVVGPFSTSDSPGTVINDNVSVSTTMTVTDDYVMTDLNVDLDITHSWTGDMQITLESPAGTQVLIFDGANDGCSANDITTLFDDESANALACDPNGGGTNEDAFPEDDYMPSNALSAFDGESSMGDWILTVEDTATGDPGVINAWSLIYDFDPIVAPPFDVVLDAMGNATVNMADLILNIDEACGFDVTTVGLPPTTNTLATLLDGGNGNFGNMFDINALTDVTMDSFDIHGDTGATFDVEVYAKAGTWVGFEADASAWTLIGTAPGIVSNGDGVVTPLNLDLGYNMAAGETHAFFVTPTDTSTGGFNYTNGTTTGAVFSADANIEFLEGAGSGIFDGNVFEPRVFNGNILYSTGTPPSATLDFDCSQLGENLVDVVVTDASGNEAFCTATVNVLDETAPIIVCVGPTTPTEMGTVSDSPGTAINDNTSVSTTISVTDDVVMTDLNVDLDITHTWTGDMQITLESPAGTQVLIFDGGSDGCSANDLAATMDDESANGLACDPNGAGTDGDAFPEADYMPSNALSAFDGESTVGDWILTVEDTATGDTGTINSWGLTYSYDGTPTDAWPIYLGPDGTVTIDPLDLILDTTEACGIATAAADITEFFCDDIDAGIIDVTIFVSDASGNIDSCVAQIRVLDNLGPDITCPADQTVDPGAGNLFYEVPDYWANGEATATDNCTDPVTITSQDPAAGTLLPDGVYTITITAEDEYGNESTCTFELTVESVLGVTDNELNFESVVMYPNPAQEFVILSNPQSLALQQAAIYDMNGRLIQTMDLNNMGTEKTIDVSLLSTATYVVVIQTEKGQITKQLLKE